MQHWKWKAQCAGIVRFILVYDLLPLQGSALDTDSENVSVGAVTLSSVVACWEGKDIQ